MRVFSWSLLAGFLSAVALTGCELGTSPVPVTNVEVTAPSSSVTVGDTLRLAATPRDASGRELSGRTVAWSSSSEAVATVSVEGMVTAMAAGSVTITATVEDRSGSVMVTVSPVPVATVSISPDTATIQAGSTRQLMAIPRDVAGNTLRGRTVTWFSSDTTRANVSSTGVVTARALGSAVITAAIEGKSASITLSVTVADVAIHATSNKLRVDDTLLFVAIARDALGRALNQVSFLWSSSDPTVLTVDSTGRARGLRIGEAEVRVSAGGKSGAVRVTVVDAVHPAFSGEYEYTARGQTRYFDCVNLGIPCTRDESYSGTLKILDSDRNTSGFEGSASLTWCSEGSGCSGPALSHTDPERTRFSTPNTFDASLFHGNHYRIELKGEVRGDTLQGTFRHQTGRRDNPQGTFVAIRRR